MSPPQAVPIPEVYVLWHPQCLCGETLARQILQWLRPGNGLGPEVYYRSLPAPEAPNNGLPPPLPGEPRASTGTRKNASNLQVVLALIDEHMVTDLAWRYWLEQLARRPTAQPRVLLPVALDATAYNMPSALRESNYLRPTGLPLPSGPVDDNALEPVVRSLLKQVTEAMCRIILPRSTDMAPDAPAKINAAPSKVIVFLSHAKQDGTVPARRIRDYIYSQTQLAAFYDENDIAFGDVFSKVIERGLDLQDTAALIAVRSALYASRPWCRREFSMFRRPRMEPASADGVERWRLYPSLVVEAMEGRQPSTGIPELGNSRVIRWDDEALGIEEFIVTTVIRDAMLASFHGALGASIPRLTTPQIVINWLPDPTTLLHIPAVQSGAECNLFYPGRGLSGLELDILGEFFPNLTFQSFEEVLS